MKTPLYLILLCLIVAIGLLFLSLFQRTTPAPVTAPSKDGILAAAQEANARATDALNKMDTMLQFIQVSGILIGAIAGIAVVFGFVNNQELRAEIDKIHDLREQVNLTMAKIENLVGEVNSKTHGLDSLQDQIHADLKAIEARNNKITEALGLAQFAQRQIAVGNLRSAADALEDACKLDPTNRINHFFLGDILLRSGRMSEGIEHLQRAREGSYRIPAADGSYAYVLRRLGDREKDKVRRDIYYAQAKALFLEIYQSDPDLVDIGGESVLGALAGLYRREGDYEEALKYYRHVHSVTPNNSYPLLNLGVVNYRLGNYADAQGCFIQARDKAEEKLRLSNADYWRWFDYVTAQIGLEADYERVSQDLERVLNLAPANDLRKLIYGLDDLRQAEKPPAHIGEYIARIEAKIEAGEAASH
jgi:tetratricopeptide (TPR) repeat protein